MFSDAHGTMFAVGENLSVHCPNRNPNTGCMIHEAVGRYQRLCHCLKTVWLTCKYHLNMLKMCTRTCFHRTLRKIYKVSYTSAFHENEIKFQNSLIAQENTHARFPLCVMSWNIRTKRRQTDTVNQNNLDFMGLPKNGCLFSDEAILVWPLRLYTRGNSNPTNRTPMPFHFEKCRKKQPKHSDTRKQTLFPEYFSGWDSQTQIKQKAQKAFFCDFRWLSTLHATMWKIVLVLSQVQYFLTEPLWWHRCDCHIGKPVVYISLMSALIRKMNPLCISDLTHVSWPDYTETSTECVAVMPGGPQYMFFLNFDFVPKTLQRNHSQLFMIFYQALPRHLFRKFMLGTFSLEFNCQIYFPAFTIKNQSAEVWEWHFHLDYSREITDVSH